VDATFAAQPVAKVLDDVCDVDVLAWKLRLLQASVQDAPGGADERMPLSVFTISGLLADEEHACLPGAFTDHGLRCTLP
jgi:hypothetical protein